MKILIPTCLTEYAQIEPMLTELCANSPPDIQIITSARQASASVNRNCCLDHLELGETAIMLDDDCRGHYHGWIDDLLAGFIDEKVVAVSARLLNRDGTFGPTCSREMRPHPEEIEVKWRGHCVMPTAAMAFKHTGIRFCEEMRGSGWEDNLWFWEVLQADPQAKFIQSNRCRLIHLNEQKQQHGSNWQHNQRVFYRKVRGR